MVIEMKITTKVMVISMITNIFLALLKVVFGFLGKSSALIADGIHSFSDLITDGCAIIGAKLSNKPADDKHPYGHGKLEYVTSIIISIIILVLGCTIISNSFNIEIVIPSIIVLIISVITIIVKLILSAFVIKVGKKYKNNILISSGYESSTDVMSSIVVLVSSGLMLLSNKISFLKYSNIVATIIVGILIIRIGYTILKDNISIMLGEQETDERYINKVKKIILKNKKVIEIDSLVLMKYGPYYKLISEISMDQNTKLKDVHNTLDVIENKIKTKDEKIKYVTIHVNPYENIDKPKIEC